MDLTDGIDHLQPFDHFAEHRMAAVQPVSRNEGDKKLRTGFKPMGPWIVTGLEPDDLHVTIRLNGKEMFRYCVGDAIFSVRQFLSRMSQYLTLYPGDVVWMGTDGPTENMKDGDVVEVEIGGIGVLRNPVVWER